MTTGLEPQVLDLLDEDDYGLWEIGWRLHGAGVETVGDLADVVQGLLDREWAVLLVQRSSTGPPQPAQGADAPVDLRDPLSWEAPGADQPSTWLSATAAGRAAYASDDGSGRAET
jgi:hypothetical protein